MTARTETLSKLTDTALVQHDDGSQYRLLPNLELVFVRGPKRGKKKYDETFLLK